MNIIIRKAEIKDVDAIIKLTIGLCKFNYENAPAHEIKEDFNETIKPINNYIKTLLENPDDSYQYFIAEINNEPVGYSIARIINTDGKLKTGLLDELFVTDRARGHKIGQKLIDESISWMKNRGMNRVKLEVYSWNINALKVYEKNGFNTHYLALEKYI